MRRTLLVCTLFALGVVMSPAAVAHDGDGKGGGCHSPVNDGVEGICTALDQGVFEPLDDILPDRVCTPAEEISVGPATVTLDEVCLE